ncbi:MAG: exodeoxyribonuclease V subunit alpha [Acidobacteriota bacterium]
MTRTPTAGRVLDRLGSLGAIDRAFGDLIARLGGDEWTTLSAALVSRERGRGHACLALPSWAGQRLDREPTDAPRGPSIATGRRHLEASDLVAVEPTYGDPVRPLVLDAADRLYLWRYWAAEQRLARRIHSILGAPAPELDLDVLAPRFRQLFPPADDIPVDWQAVAAVTALLRPFTLVSGGPGTGKTTTVRRLLALLRAARPDLRVALAAPTGKAATRLESSLLTTPDELTEDRPATPARASTLHRLLGYHPRDDRFRHRAEHPLTTDLLVLDEASMVDLLLIDATLDALPEGGRMILLGDRDQLASVDAGFVFGDLCRAAGLGARAAVDDTTRELFHRLAGRPLPETLPPPDAAHPALVGVGTELRISFRFRHRRGIGALADAIRDRDPKRAIRALDDANLDEITRATLPRDALDVLDPIVDGIDAVLDAETPGEALERLDAFRILCVTRVGTWGTERLNRLVELALERRGHPTTETFYPGRPILVEANDYQVRLWNGDLGICWRDQEGLWAFFPGDTSDTLRRMPLAKVPPHATAWAMTVHKSQGSELDRVLIVLPESADIGGELLSRELFYTAVTRARDHVDIVGSTEVIEAAIRRSARRASGLVDALGHVGDASRPSDRTI